MVGLKMVDSSRLFGVNMIGNNVIEVFLYDLSGGF
jgi:hypothetical protein